MQQERSGERMQSLVMTRFGIVAIICAYFASFYGNSAAAQGMMDHVDLTSPKMSSSDLSRTDIEAMIATGAPVDLQDKSLNGIDLSGLDLTGADLRWARLNRANLQNAKLDGAKLDLAWAIEVNLAGASLVGANLFQTQLLRASMQGVDLSGARIVADMSNAQLEQAVFTDADMAADMKNQSMGLMRTILRSAKLQGADFRGAKLGRADMEFAQLMGADLRDADFMGAELGGANLTEAKVAGLNLDNADLDSTTLKELQGRDEIVGLDRARNLNRAYSD